jgi:hypothetical protein
MVKGFAKYGTQYFRITSRSSTGSSVMCGGYFGLAGRVGMHVFFDIVRIDNLIKV